MPDTAVAHIDGDAEEGPWGRRGRRRVLLGAAALVLAFAGTVPPILIDSSAETQVQADRPGLETFAAVSATTDPGTGAAAEAPMVTTVPSTPDPEPTSTPPIGRVPGAVGPAAPGAVPTTVVLNGSAPTTAKPTVTTVPPTAVVTCRNSADPACGPFRFDPQPGNDLPMTVQAVVGPTSPVAGQEVVFQVTLADPDGVTPGSSLFHFGDSGTGGSSFAECKKYGPWDPPARDPSRATEIQEVRHTYAKAGTYTATFSFEAGPFGCVDSVTGRGDRPYASGGIGTVTVVVT